MLVLAAYDSSYRLSERYSDVFTNLGTQSCGVTPNSNSLVTCARSGACPAVQGKMETKVTNHKIVPGNRKMGSESVMKGILRDVMGGVLKNVGPLSGDETVRQCKLLSDIIKDKLKLTGWERCRYVVQVMLGEQRGQGANISSRCFWHQDMDIMASETYIGVSSQNISPPHII